MIAERIGRRVVRYGTVASTMDETVRLAESGEPEGTVVVAAEQTAGRGRAGRVWIAPPGSALLCSVLLRPTVPPARLPVLSLLIGAAAAEAIERATGLPCRLKWPNDLWLGNDEPGRKVGGVLVTSRVERDGAGYAVAGIGINISGEPVDLPPGAASLSAEVGQAVVAETVLRHLIDRLNYAYDDYLGTGGHPDLDPWRRRAALVGQIVTITDGDRRHVGRFTGIDGDGRLLLLDEAGTILPIIAGDLTRGPRSFRR